MSVLNIPEQLMKIGVTVVNNKGEMRTFPDVLNDIQNEWSKLDEKQKLEVTDVLFSK